VLSQSVSYLPANSHGVGEDRENNAFADFLDFGLGNAGEAAGRKVLGNDSAVKHIQSGFQPRKLAEGFLIVTG